ncbi:MAG: hypothetical protein R3F19_09810 [Verrucomicrobiales bacterium]
MTRSKFLALTLGFVCTLAQSGLADESATTLKVGKFTFSGDKSWAVKSAPRTMSAGGFTLTGEGEKLDADFYYFGKGQGGTTEANIARWQGQFKEKPEPKKETLTFGEQKVHIIKLEGTFLEGPPFGQKKEVKGQAMLGAIVESGDGHVFVKMTGAKKAIEAAAEAFKALCSSPFKK